MDSSSSAANPFCGSETETSGHSAGLIARKSALVLLICLAVAQVCHGLENRNSPEPLRIVIKKESQVLELYRNGVRVKSYRVCLGVDSNGPKTEVGDKKTPEGDYFICTKQSVSKFHRFLGISYPGEQDAQSAFEKGRISLNTRDSIIRKIKEGKTPPWDTKLGGWVGIHGYPSDESKRKWVALLFPKPTNWTDGCIAVWNFEIEELFSRVPVGTPVTILP